MNLRLKGMGERESFVGNTLDDSNHRYLLTAYITASELHVLSYHLTIVMMTRGSFCLNGEAGEKISTCQ